MNKLIKPILITLFAISLFIVVPATQAEAGLKVSPKLVKLGNHYQKKFGGPSTKYKGRIPKGSMITMLTLGWKSFGYSNAQAERRAKLNYKQVMAETGARPYAVQGLCDVNGCPGDKTAAGGLFQFIPATFKNAKIRGYNNRFNAADNILAVINIQVNAKTIYTTGALDGKGARKIKILAGQGGWGFSGLKNPYR
jgi:hypothetical protein